MRPALSRNVAASVVNAAAAVSTSLVTVPLILDAVGTAGYGVWTLGLALILYASILETGVGPAIQRFTAYARGSRDTDAFDLPARLQHDAESMFRILGAALALALLAAGMGNLLQGLERFGMLALSAGAGALAFLAAIIALAHAE